MWFLQGYPDTWTQVGTYSCRNSCTIDATFHWPQWRRIQLWELQVMLKFSSGESVQNRTGSDVQRSFGPSCMESHWRQCTKLDIWISLWRIHQHSRMFGGLNRYVIAKPKNVTLSKGKKSPTIICIVQRGCLLGFYTDVWNPSCNMQLFKTIRNKWTFLCCDCSLSCGTG